MSELTITITITEAERQAIANEVRRRALTAIVGLDVSTRFDHFLGRLEQVCKEAERCHVGAELRGNAGGGV